MSGILAVGKQICEHAPAPLALNCLDSTSQRLALLAAAGSIAFTYSLASYGLHRFQNRPIKDLTGEKVFAAAQAGNLSLIKRYIAGRSKLNCRFEGKTPLMVAAAKGHSKIVYSLLVAGRVNSNEKEADNMTALHHAAKNGHMAALEHIFRCCSKDTKHAHNSMGNTPVFLAASGGHLHCVKTLDSSKSRKNLKGQTILHPLAKKGIFFQSKNPEWDAQDQKGNTPLHYAVTAGNRESALQYLNRTTKAKANCLNRDGFNPLHLAILRSGDIQLVSDLIASGKFDLGKETRESVPRLWGQLMQGLTLREQEKMQEKILFSLFKQQLLNRFSLPS